ncbi:uncharacterized protein LOC128991659 [Macrosteles quadrilineatus]|uniref:uncharacterized protein LOC128991659 n=1 Tax=Macrosteles quadrilineatus TaxID=74068 RepID=UPI0023E103A9|nr:uncharacterized protein LOC128991659 [Macrosteles quadrilineatus]
MLSTHRQQPQQPENPAFRQNIAITTTSNRLVPSSSAPDFIPRPGPSTAPDYIPRPGPSTAPDCPMIAQPTVPHLIGYTCDGCGKTFSRKNILRTHARFSCRIHRSETALNQPSPASPSINLSSPQSTSDEDDTNDQVEIPDNLAPQGFEEIETAFKGRLKTYCLSEPAENTVSLLEFLNDIRDKKKKNHFMDPDKHIVYPLRVADRELVNHFDLLLITNDVTTHYVWIKSFTRLVSSQLTLRGHRLYICKRCFAHFDNQPTKLGLRGEERLLEHQRYCFNNAPLRTDLAEDKTIHFKNFERTQRSRFTIYADFECALVPLEPEQTIDPSPTVPPPAWDPALARGARRHRPGEMLNARNVHVPYAYAYYIRDDNRNVSEGDTDDNDHTALTFSKLRLYRGEDAAQHFIKSIRDDVQKIGDIVYGQRLPNDPPRLTQVEEDSFREQTVCYICKREFTILDPRVKDHQHSPPYTYRGAAHRSCNIRHKEQDTINIYLHNLSNYDAHFIIRELSVDKGNINVLANTEEKYITFSKRFKYPGAGRQGGLKLQFVDSYRLMSKALGTLASILPADKLKITKSRFPNQEQFDLLRRKGVFPYEYISSMEVLEEDVLPPKCVFGEGVSDADYEHAQRVWEKFDCTTLGQYADIYLATDVLLLADVFEGFREMCLTHYGLDPARYLTLPSYAWDVMMFKTDVILDTLQDIDMYLFFEKGIRGGLTQCVTRHVVANNKFTRMETIGNDRDGQNAAASSEYCDERDDDTFIMYYDANNLYGWAMSELLPHSEFEWLSRQECDDLDIGRIPTDGEYGYVLEVDLEYPRDPALHDRHRDLPFCPEICKAPINQLPYSLEEIINSGAGKSKKLMATLMDKREYVIHYRYLQQAIENGLRVTRIHRVIRFKQSAWLKPYVTMNTELRQRAANKFEVEMFKLMVNAVYGMSLQNVRKHQDLKIASSRKTYTKYVAKANFNDRIWLNENLAILNMSKVRVVLSKPVYAGMCILDHSKRWMYGFHYDMVDRYGIDRISMIYMDTDGCHYSIRTKNVYRDMLEHLDDFDTSNYPRNHICYDGGNARVLGKFKDEAAGVAIKMFIGLMSKLYCFTYSILTCAPEGDNGDGANCIPPPVKRAKGVNRAVVKRDLTIEDYLNCLYNKTTKSTDNQRFQSRHHILYTVVVKKRSMAPFDDKRYVMPEDGINTLPWGHYAIPPLRVPQILEGP